MFLNKFFYFIKGYVIIRAEGKNTERFINLCVRRGIRLIAPEKLSDGVLSAAIPMRDFLRLAPVAYKSGCRITIKSKHSPMHFIRSHRSGFAYAAGALFFPVLLMITSQFIWSVEINGAQDTDIQQLSALLAEHNIRVGGLKRNMPDPGTCKKIILNNTEGLTWAWVYTEGTKIRVEIREGRPAPDIPDTETPCDIVAARDGVVRTVSAKNGIALVRENAVVCEGDVLIAGTIDTVDFGLYTVHADGEVYADTVHRAYGYYPTEKTVYTRTGTEKTRYSINLFSKNIPLYTDKAEPFEKYECKTEKWEASLGKSFRLGFGITRDTYYETQAQTQQLTKDYIAQAAREELEKQIASELNGHAVLTDSEFTLTETEQNTVFAELTMEFNENIGLYVPMT